MTYKPCFSLLLGISLALIISCANLRSSNQPSRPDSVVLEIVTDARGVVYPKEGDILNMRLYESGRFEHDDYPDQDPPRVMTGNVVITRREGRLSADAVRELVGLAEQPDFLASNENYSSIRPHIDDIWVTKIHFTYQGRDKRISVVNFWDIHSFPEDERHYPASMVRLLKRASELKAQALRRN